ncbi:MAG TPA: type II toxin-antitoxin system VapC family toxin [Acidobacteriaceae bacterium]|nr:type II toxin-antitoxin system VapC family toxin [Acidobacteriaceae bacterium]
MILDSSALTAILGNEPEAADPASAIEAAGECRISAVNYVEAAAVIDGSRDPAASRRFDDLVREAAVAIDPVRAVQAQPAREGYRDSGKGSGHPAQLNFGDCFAYALARSAGQPLLVKGSDFSRTDIASALP